MQKNLSVLSQCPLFDGIAPENIGAMLACLNARTLSSTKGQTLFFEGAPATDVGIVLQGAVQMVREDYYGNRSIVAHIGPGGLFGETYACAGISALPVSMVACEDCRVLCVDCRRITQSCTNACAFHSRIVFNLLRLVAEKNLMFDQKIQITSKRTTREKLMTYLLNQAKQHNSSRFTIPYDRQELADYLEVDRAGLSAEIGKLRREGVLKSDKSQFELL